MSRPGSVLIVGGGVSGLSLAYFLQKSGVPFLLCEKESRFGGNIRTEAHDGFLYDVGPDSFLRTRPEALQLAKDIGLEEELITPSPDGGRVFVAHDGRLLPMPEGMSLGVPTRIGALLGSELLSDVGKARALLEPFVPKGAGAEESILSFCERRLGPEMARRVAAPLLAGVFAGDASELSMRAAFPQLVALEQKYGSLVVGMSGGRSLFQILLDKPKAHPSPFVTFRRGLSTFIERLVSSLPEGSLRLGAKITRLERRGASFDASIDGVPHSFSNVVLAGPPFSAVPLLASVDARFHGLLSTVRASPTATAFFGLENHRMANALEGSGFIVPPGEGNILAATYISSKWSARAPQGTTLVRAFLGGARGVGPDLKTSTDQALSSLAYSELTRFLGTLGTPLFAKVFRYPFGTPQPGIGHLERLEQLKVLLAEVPGLHVLGPGFGGVGIPDCVRQASELSSLLCSENSQEKAPAGRLAS